MIDLNLTKLITLKVNNLNTPTEIVRVKTRPNYYAAYREKHIKYKDKNGLKVKKQKKVYHAKTSKKKASVTPLISVTSKFQSKGYPQVNLRSFRNYKGISQEDIAIFKVYSLNNRVSKYMEQKNPQKTQKPNQTNKNSRNYKEKQIWSQLQLEIPETSSP